MCVFLNLELNKDKYLSDHQTQNKFTYICLRKYHKGKKFGLCENKKKNLYLEKKIKRPLQTGKKNHNTSISQWVITININHKSKIKVALH